MDTGKPRPGAARWPLIALLLLAAGCENDDAGRLSRAAGRAVARLQAAVGWAGESLPAGWREAHADLGQPTLEARVAARIRWDKNMAGADVQANATGSTVELHGKVRDVTQRIRAQEIAQATAGVEKVTNSLELAGR